MQASPGALSRTDIHDWTPSAEIRTYQIFRSVQDSREGHFLEDKKLLVEGFWRGFVAQVADLVKSL